MHLLPPVSTLLILENLSTNLNFVLNLDKIVCYHGSWANYRPGTCRYTVDHIDPHLCTHIMYGFVGINADGSIRIMDSWLDIDLGKHLLQLLTNILLS